MIEIDKIGKSTPFRLGMHSPEVASFLPNLAIQKGPFETFTYYSAIAG